MPRFNEEQLQKIYDERKKQITQAAVRIFARRGLTGTKISMITAEAGVSHGLFYHYFKTKEDLFISLIREAIDTSMATIDNLCRAPGSPLEKIKMLTEAILEKDGAPFFMLLLQARNPEGVPEEVTRLIGQYPMGVYVERLLPLFREGQEKGEIAGGDLKELISAYLTILSGVMVLGANEGYVLPRADMLMRFVQKGQPVPEAR